MLITLVLDNVALLFWSPRLFGAYSAAVLDVRNLQYFLKIISMILIFEILHLTL